MNAVSRIALYPQFTNIQTSWVNMGPQGAKVCLNAGANDLGGTRMNESISRAAGAAHGQEMPPESMEKLILELGRTPAQRPTLFESVSEARASASFGAKYIIIVADRKIVIPSRFVALSVSLIPKASLFQT